MDPGALVIMGLNSRKSLHTTGKRGWCTLQVCWLVACLLACRVIEALIDLAGKAGCYKVILDCSEENATFYEKCGLYKKEVQMVSWQGSLISQAWQTWRPSLMTDTAESCASVEV